MELTRGDLLTINNALNEVCNGIHLEGEFDTRMGCSVEEAGHLLDEVHQLIKFHEAFKVMHCRDSTSPILSHLLLSSSIGIFALFGSAMPSLV